MRQESCFYYSNNKYRYGYTKCTRQTEQSTNSSISNRSAVMYCYLIGLKLDWMKKLNKEINKNYWKIVRRNQFLTNKNLFIKRASAYHATNYKSHKDT